MMSDLKVVDFKRNDESEYNQTEVIRLLEEALEHARNVNYQAMAIVMLSHEGHVLDCWHNGEKPYVMVGALESLKMDYIHACIERR